jgi:hypothetical protein
MEDEDGGLFNIEISSEDEAENESEKVPRDFQSEKDFQRQRAQWKPKIEVGEVRNISDFLHIQFWSWIGTLIHSTTAMEDLEATDRQSLETRISDYSTCN